MNHNDPRIDKAMDAQLKALGREDGRPEAYAVPVAPQNKGYRCAACANEGHTALHPHGKVAMLSPIYTASQQAEFLCTEKHLPRDVVIYDPMTNKCRDLNGNEWTEGAPLSVMPVVDGETVSGKPETQH